jgi:hypothetical protein
MDGLRNGEYKLYNEDGDLVEIRDYRGGVLVNQ